ncbi:hypothetical protein AWB75_06811 [Caballeronia catudaia]|uniref:Uncharacterized protein n=1 Tax=Caballeronia catudaia TaxID=1777136 RepID=A0A158DJ67_9BURK|nr:hypothetical protein AWB75_06811 [Caballeronia catudaia]
MEVYYEGAIIRPVITQRDGVFNSSVAIRGDDGMQEFHEALAVLLPLMRQNYLLSIGQWPILMESRGQNPRPRRCDVDKIMLG